MSRASEWRRPVGDSTEDPDVLLQRAEELIHRATQAAASRSRPSPAASPKSEPDEPTARTKDDESTAAPLDEPPKETTIRLVINSSGKAAATISAEEWSEEDEEVPAARLMIPERRLSLAAAQPSPPPIAAKPSAKTATGGDSQSSRIPIRRAELVEPVDYASSDQGVVYATEEELLPPQVPGPFVDDGRAIISNGQFVEGNCGDACAPVQRPLFWVAGVEASFLWPDLNREGGTSFAFADEGEQYSQFGESSFADDVDSMYFTPRIWFGVQGCAWGANVRYWHLRACEGDFNPATGAREEWGYDEWAWEKTPDVGFFDSTCLDAYTIDLEITRRFCLHDCAMQASFGVRHGSIENDESVVGTALGDDARFVGYARSNRYSRGTGIVMGLYGRKPLFPCSCVNWFYNARWSALWGPTGTSAETFAAVTIDGGNAGSVNGASTKVSDTLIIGEIQLGLEWNYALQCLPANAFLRTAIEYQRWDGGKGYSEAGSFATYSDDDDWTATANTFASSPEPQMDLVGITVGTGLTW